MTDSQFSLGVAPDSSPEEELSLALALVTSAKDTHPIPQVWSFQTLVEVFSTPQVRTHKDGPAWIPATLGGTVNSRGGLRHSDNVLCLHALVLDIDKTPYTAEALKARLEGYTYLCHTTYSHTPAHPRWRVILPLAYPIPPTQLKDALLNTSNELDLQCDTACTDSARLFFLPSCPAHHREHYQVILGRGQGFKANVTALKPPPHSASVQRPTQKTPLPQETKVPSQQFNKALDSSALLNCFPFTLDRVAAAYRDPAISQRLVTYLNWPLKGNFRSPLPWRHDRTPSANLFRHRTTGEWVLKDFGEAGGVYSLAQVYALQHYGRPHKLGAVEIMMWCVRLLLDAGILQRPSVNLPPCPEGSTPTERRYYDGFKRLLECRECVYEWKDNPVTFSQTFASAWCEISAPSVVKAFAKMKSVGVMVEVGFVKCRFPKPTARLLPGKAVTLSPTPDIRFAEKPKAPKGKHKDFVAKAAVRHQKNREAVEAAARQLQRDFVDTPLRVDEVVAVLAFYSNVPKSYIQKHHWDLVLSIIGTKRGRRK